MQHIDYHEENIRGGGKIVHVIPFSLYPTTALFLADP